MSETPQPEVKTVLPPPNLYNQAVLEAFRAAAPKVESWKQHHDLVVILGGSFSKGLGNFFSDTDTLFISKEPLNARDLNGELRIEQEFNRIAKEDPKYVSLKRYASLGRTIERREEHLIDEGIVEGGSSEWASRYGNQSALLQRAFHSPDVNHPDLSDRYSFAGPELATADVENEVLQSIQTKVTEFDPKALPSYIYFDDLITVLSADIGVNAYEVTEGQLFEYQSQLVDSLRHLQTNDPRRYEQLQGFLNECYLQFTRQKHFEPVRPKSPKLTQTLMRTEVGEPVLRFYREFGEFPTVEQLDAFLVHPPTSGHSS